MAKVQILLYKNITVIAKVVKEDNSTSLVTLIDAMDIKVYPPTSPDSPPQVAFMPSVLFFMAKDPKNISGVSIDKFDFVLEPSNEIEQGYKQFTSGIILPPQSGIVAK